MTPEQQIMAFVIAIVGIIITIGLTLFRLGRWVEKIETNLNTMSDNINSISEKIDKLPGDFLAKFIDALKFWEMGKAKSNPGRKEELLEKARRRTITYQESLELRDILKREADAARAVGDFVKFLLILGLIIFIGAIIAELFGEQ